MVSHQVDVAPDRAVAAAAERDVEVVAQEARQGDVPAPPEVDDAGRLVGRAKLSGRWMPNSRDRPIAMSRVAGEVEVELERVGQRRRSRRRPGRVGACGRAKASGTKPATPSASTTFLNSPMTKMVRPDGEVVGAAGDPAAAP